MYDSGVAGMLGRPDLASGYGEMMAAPVVGQRSDSLMGSGISGSVSLSGDVGTGQASLSLAAALVVLLAVMYFATRSHQH
jgi:hypothetical protein